MKKNRMVWIESGYSGQEFPVSFDDIEELAKDNGDYTPAEEMDDDVFYQYANEVIGER